MKLIKKIIETINKCFDEMETEDMAEALTTCEIV